MSNLIIELIPETYVKYIGPALLILVGFAVEKHYTGRIPFFTNAMAINLIFYGWPSLHTFVWIYVNIGLLFGLYSLWSYIQKNHESKEFYELGGLFYSSISTGIVLLLAIGFETGFIQAT